MAGVAGGGPPNPAVAGGRSYQFNHTPPKGGARKYAMSPGVSTDIAHFFEERIRAADAKEVGVGNPAEETYRYPNQSFLLLTLSIGPQLSMHKGPKRLISISSNN